MGYEAKICTYDFYLFSPGQRDMFDPVIVGDFCESVFAVASKSMPVEANMAVEKAYKRGDFITGTVVWRVTPSKQGGIEYDKVIN